MGEKPEGLLVTLHLHRVAPAMVPAALARMAVDRPALRRGPMRFAKLVGTGDGRTFDARDVDLRTWGLLAVWDHPGDLVRWEAASHVAAGWSRLASESWRADLRPLRSHGRWAGVEPFGTPTGVPSDGPVAAITRARLAWSRMRTFWSAVPPVVTALDDASGLRMRVGIGEAPVGLQGTFSVWESEDAMTDFAYRHPAHLDAVRRTTEVGWYAEELFARFAVLQTTGTLGGADPLGGILD